MKKRLRNVSVSMLVGLSLGLLWFLYSGYRAMQETSNSKSIIAPTNALM